jgi:Mg2+ and Co2+ transporter CorA
MRLAQQSDAQRRIEIADLQTTLTSISRSLTVLNTQLGSLADQDKQIDKSIEDTIRSLQSQLNAIDEDLKHIN